MDALHLQLRLRLAQLIQLRRIHLRGRPERRQCLHPAVRFKPPQHPQRILLESDLLQLIPALELAHAGDKLFIPARLVPLLRPFIQRPAQPRHQPRRPHHSDRILDKSMVRDQPQLAVLNIRHPVQRIHQQTVRPLIQRERHRIRREIPPPQIVQDPRGLQNRLVRLRVRHRQRRPDLHPHRSRKGQIHCLAGLKLTRHRRPGLLEILPQLQRIALHHHVQITHRRSTGQIANRAAHQKHSQTARTRQLTNLPESAALRGRESVLQQIDIISHADAYAPSGPSG